MANIYLELRVNLLVKLLGDLLVELLVDSWVEHKHQNMAATYYLYLPCLILVKIFYFTNQKYA